MENVKTNTPNVEDMMQLMRPQRSSKPRFQLRMEQSKAFAVMMAAWRIEVEDRYREFRYSADVEIQITQFVKWMTQQSPQFGVIICGNCGNGKTTMVKAFLWMLNFLGIRDDWNNTVYGIQIVTAKDIVQLYKADFIAWKRLAQRPIIAIDDLGTEPTALIDVGNTIPPSSTPSRFAVMPS